MKREMPWIGQSPELISGIHHRKIGRARLLLDFYVHHQTDKSGRVYYGKPVTYRWIAARIIDCPSERTLERYNRKLRAGGYISTRTVVHDGAAIGFSIVVRNQAKFRTAPQTVLAQQIGLFNAPVQIPVQKQRIPAEGVPTTLSAGADRSVGVKDFKKEKGGHETGLNPARQRAELPAAVGNGQQTQKFAVASWRQKQKAHRILREIEVIREAYAGAYGDDLVRRDAKLNWLYDELERTGWQDARAG